MGEFEGNLKVTSAETSLVEEEDAEQSALGRSEMVVSGTHSCSRTIRGGSGWKYYRFVENSVTMTERSTVSDLGSKLKDSSLLPEGSRGNVPVLEH